MTINVFVEMCKKLYFQDMPSEASGYVEYFRRHAVSNKLHFEAWMNTIESIVDRMREEGHDLSLRTWVFYMCRRITHVENDIPLLQTVRVASSSLLSTFRTDLSSNNFEDFGFFSLHSPKVEPIRPPPPPTSPPPTSNEEIEDVEVKKQEKSKMIKRAIAKTRLASLNKRRLMKTTSPPITSTPVSYSSDTPRKQEEVSALSKSDVNEKVFARAFVASTKLLSRFMAFSNIPLDISISSSEVLFFTLYLPLR